MSTELVGREEELQRVELFLDAARHAPRALVIEGEAGAGKTSIWEAALTAAARAGTPTLAARPAEAETSFAYAALGDLLRDQLEAVADLPSRQRRALEVALRLDDERDDAPDQQSVALAVLTVFRQLAQLRPLVVAIDDVQWLDAASASVLRYAVRRLDAGPVGLLAAWRTEPGAPVPLELDRAPTAERLERIPLSPLSLGAVQRLITQRLDFLPPRPALRRLHELSGGNPFFALELARAFQEGAIQLEAGERLPVALDELVGARLEALSPGRSPCARCSRCDGATDGRARRSGGRRRRGCAGRGRAGADRLRARRPRPLRPSAPGIRGVRRDRRLGAT